MGRNWSSCRKSTDKKAISKEKIKQKRIMQLHGNKFKAIEEYKECVDQKDKFLVYQVDENKQIVFLSSIVKWKLPQKSLHLLIFMRRISPFRWKDKQHKALYNFNVLCLPPFITKQIPLVSVKWKSFGIYLTRRLKKLMRIEYSFIKL